MGRPPSRWTDKVFGRKSATSVATDDPPAFPASRADAAISRLAVHTGIDKARAAGLPLAEVEKVVFFADSFDSYFQNGGFDGFHGHTADGENIDDHYAALNALQLYELVAVIRDGERRYADLNARNESLWGTVPDRELSRMYLDVSDDVSRQIHALGIDIEAVLERYVDANYPWKQP